MTKKQIRTALQIVDDVHRVEANTTPGGLTFVKGPVHLVIAALSARPMLRKMYPEQAA